MSLAETIKKVRLKLMLDQEEFGNLIGVGRQAVSYYETGVRKPGLKTLRRLKEVARQNNIKIKFEGFLD